MADQQTPPAHEIAVLPSGHADVQQCYSVRIDVFHHEQKFPLETEIDDLDQIATHFLLRLTPSLAPAGTIRASKAASGKYYKLSRLAVLKDYRGYRFGRELVLALHDWVREDAARSGAIGFAEVIAHSQLPVKAFYAKFGYEPEGAEFDEDGASHQKMVARISIRKE